jgi:membrane-associated phospholipid phosphatase
VVAGQFKELLPCFLMVFAYPFVPIMIRASGVADLDAVLLRADEWMFGGENPHFWISARLHPWLTEWFALCYSLYGALILAVFGILILSDRQDELRRFVFRFVLVLAIGYSFYAWVPVQGPVFTLDFKEHLDLRYLQGVKEALMDRARIERDCFPSLHTALSLLAWGTLAGVSARLGRILIPVVISIPVACVYLRYHYVIDVVAGAMLVSGVFWSTKKRRQAGSPA